MADITQLMAAVSAYRSLTTGNNSDIIGFLSKQFGPAASDLIAALEKGVDPVELLGSPQAAEFFQKQKEVASVCFVHCPYCASSFRTVLK